MDMHLLPHESLERTISNRSHWLPQRRGAADRGPGVEGGLIASSPLSPAEYLNHVHVLPT